MEKLIFDMTVQAAVAMQNIWPVLDLVPHMEVAQIGIEKIRSHVVWAIHSHEKNRSESHVSKKKNRIWDTFACSLNVTSWRMTKRYGRFSPYVDI